MSWVTKITVFLQPLEDRQELLLEPAAYDRIDGAEGFVHQHHRRIGCQRPGHADTLALPARKMARIACEI